MCVTTLIYPNVPPPLLTHIYIILLPLSTLLDVPQTIVSLMVPLLHICISQAKKTPGAELVEISRATDF